MQRFLSRAALPALVLALAAACGENPATPPAVVEQGPAQFVIVSGNDQWGAAGEELAQPVVVRAVDANGAPIAGRHVGFTVVAGGGQMFVGGGVSDANGIVKDYWRLGTVALDSQRIEARSVDPATGAKQVFGVFRANSIAGAPAKIVVLTSMPAAGWWRQPVRSLILDSVRVALQDRFGNRVQQAGIAVQWLPSHGGNVSTSSGITTTNSQGVAATQWRLGTVATEQTLRAGLNGGAPSEPLHATATHTSPSVVTFSADSVHLTSLSAPVPLTVTATDKYGNPVPYTVTSQNTGVVRVGSDQGLTSAANGKTRVVVTAGNHADTAVVTVQQVAASIAFRVIPAVKVGGTLAMNWYTVIRDASGHTMPNGTGIWTSSNPAVASVAADGTVTAHAQGTFTITVSKHGVTRETATITVNP